MSGRSTKVKNDRSCISSPVNAVLGVGLIKHTEATLTYYLLSIMLVDWLLTPIRSRSISYLVSWLVDNYADTIRQASR